MGGYFLRYYTDSKQRWHKLAAIKERAARQESNGLKVKLALWKAGTGKNPFAKELVWKDVAADYLKAGCPNSRNEPRDEKFCEGETWRIEKLTPYFGRMALEKINTTLVPKYGEWRMKRVTKGTGHRSVEIECVTLSNVISYAVRAGLTPTNNVRSLRPRFCTTDPRTKSLRLVTHCRENAPESGDEVHKLVTLLFGHWSSEVLGWQFAWECLTGCRTNEVLRWRIDGKDEATPGYVQANCLFLARSKRGINPYFHLQPEHLSAIEAHRYWLAERYPESPSWFPGRGKGEFPVDKGSLSHALRRLCGEHSLPHRTSHACRSFYVSKRRSDGISDAQIAAEIGITNVQLISRTYGNCPPSWFGQKKLSFLPSEGFAAWDIWRPKTDKVVNL